MLIDRVATRVLEIKETIRIANVVFQLMEGGEELEMSQTEIGGWNTGVRLLYVEVTKRCRHLGHCLWVIDGIARRSLGGGRRS